jgi:CHASE2 domain-containing sensor protein/tRNA A-37 threonylcarbamoyl transferase component Bud32
MTVGLQNPRKKARGIDFVLGLGLTLLVAILSFLPLKSFEVPQFKLYDLGLRIRGAIPVPKEVIIATIDDASVATLGRWPWPRQKIAELIDYLSQAGAKIIAVDLTFLPTESERLSGNDRVLAEAIQRAGNVVLPFYFTLGESKNEGKKAEIPPQVSSSAFLLFDDPRKFFDFPPPSAEKIFASVPEISRAARAMGHINVLPDPDGKVRWEPLIVHFEGQYYPSFSMQIAALAMGLTRGDVRVNVGRSIHLGKINIPTNPQGRLLIRYYGGNQSVPYRSFVEILSGKIPVDTFRGKIVFIGVTAAGANDFLSTPFSNRLPGVEKHAQAVSAFLQGRFISRPSWVSFLEFGLILLTGLLMSFFLPGVRPAFQLIFCLAFFLALGGLTVGALSQGIWVKVFFPGLLLILQYILVTARRAPVTEKEVPTETEVSAVMGAERKEPAWSEGNLRMEAGGPGSKIDRYEVLSELGRGAMGVVFKGKDPIIDRPVAIKTIRFDRLYEEHEIQGLKERFFKEAQAAGKLSHPNIVTIFDVGEDRGLSYIAMEYVEGEVLSRYILRDHLLPVEEVLEIIAQAAEALDFAHQHKVIHRDIKPANIMRTSEGQIKVMDFGIAKIPSSTLTQAGSVLGTPSYMSPEQIRGEDLDGRSDLFSLGCVLYELLTGVKPFRGGTLAALSYQITQVNPLPASRQNPQVPPAGDEVLNRALAKNPADRYLRGKAMAQALREVLRGLKKNPQNL